MLVRISLRRSRPAGLDTWIGVRWGLLPQPDLSVGRQLATSDGFAARRVVHDDFAVNRIVQCRCRRARESEQEPAPVDVATGSTATSGSTISGWEALTSARRLLPNFGYVRGGHGCPAARECNEISRDLDCDLSAVSSPRYAPGQATPAAADGGQAQGLKGNVLVSRAMRWPPA
jgi:hypothetical protein